MQMMQLHDIWDWIKKNIFTLPSHESVRHPIFNPYQDRQLDIDIPNAIYTRQKNLYNYLAIYPERPYILVIGEAIGWRGGRFSGVPFSSEAQMVRDELPFSGLPSSQNAKPYSEATATIFWKILYQYFPKFIAWNCIPLHPYRPNNPLSNRRPTSDEIFRYRPLLLEFIEIISPDQIIALGRTSRQALTQLGIPHHPVRHPSHGGAHSFEAGIQSVLGNPPKHS